MPDVRRGEKQGQLSDQDFPDLSQERFKKVMFQDVLNTTSEKGLT